MAMAHEYVWAASCKYPGAPETRNANKYLCGSLSYDLFLFGDNHKGFLTSSAKSKQRLINPGTLMRRKSDEICYSPAYYRIYSDGSVDAVPLDTSIDEFLDNDIEEEIDIAAKDLVRRLDLDPDQTLDFLEILRNEAEDDIIARVIVRAIQDCKA
jgi:hypothetical protein